MRRAIVAALWLALSTAGGAASAQQPSESELDAHLRAANASANYWHWTWTGIFSASIVSSGVLVGVAADDAKSRGAQAMGAVAPKVVAR